MRSRCQKVQVSWSIGRRSNEMQSNESLFNAQQNQFKIVFYNISFVIFFRSSLGSQRFQCCFGFVEIAIGKYAFLSRTPRSNKENQIGWRWTLKLKTVWTTKQCQVAAAMHNALANPANPPFQLFSDKIFLLICISKETPTLPLHIWHQDQSWKYKQRSNQIKPAPPSYSAQPIQLAGSG